MAKSNFSLIEKAEMIIKNLKNLNSLDLNLNEVRFSCPVCNKEYFDTIQSTWRRMFYSPTGELKEYFSEKNILTCKNKICSNKFSQIRESVLNKKKETCLKKYGVESYLVTNDSKEKCKENIIKKYGSYKNKLKESWKSYELKTGYSHNMRNPESAKKNQKNRVNTILNMSKEQKENWYQQRINSHKQNGTKLFGEKGSSYCVSNIQIELFKELENNNLHILYGSKEKIIWIDEKKYYKVDGYLPDKNIIIEFYGDYWHANPERYQRDSVLSLPNGKFLAEEIWNRDNERKNNIISALNCKFIIVWESHFRNDKKTVIDNILKEIN